MPETQATNPPTFETVWAALMENREQLKETAQIVKEVGEKQKELVASQKETDRQLKEDSQRLKEENDKRIGALTNLFGDLTEGMVAPKICKKFEEIGLIFPKANRDSRLNDKVNNISLEVDIMLENGDKAMLIEVKTKLSEERIDKHILRLEKMRRYADLNDDKRTFLGAVAGIAVTDDLKKYALSKGLYFIEYAGETFYITPPGGEAKEW